MARQTTSAKDTSTEEKIKEAARKLFIQKGYAAVKTRDIAQEANINLALLNYYFRSKEKLFNIIMMESMQQFIKGIALLFNDTKLSTDKKIESLVEEYITMLTTYPDLPLFILSEIRHNPQKLAHMFDKEINISRSAFFVQMQGELKRSDGESLHLLHFISNLMGLMVFPFVASPVLKNITHTSDKQFTELMNERKKLIPIWIKAMLKAKK